MTYKCKHLALDIVMTRSSKIDASHAAVLIQRQRTLNKGTNNVQHNVFHFSASWFN